MRTKLIKLDVNRPSLDVIHEAAALVDSGGLVAFPTETVYGIAARAKSDTLAKLTEIKGRSAEKYYSLHIGLKEQLKNYVPNLSPTARQLVKKAWPGPLTIVFELSENDLQTLKESMEADTFNSLYRDNTIGIRCPDDVIGSLLLSHTAFPVVASSANLSNAEPATNGQDALANLDGKIDMVLDGGQCKYNKSSTVVKIGACDVSILREGVYSERDIRAMSEINILFVCTGNTCRSPMAAGLCRKYLAQKLGCSVDRLENMGYKISSAGVTAVPGWPASPEAIEVCNAKGIDISGHRTTPLGARLIEQSDLIFAMCEHHRRSVLSISPGAAQKCMLLDQKDIPDPIGGSEKEYYYCAELIEKALIKRISEFVK